MNPALQALIIRKQSRRNRFGNESISWLEIMIMYLLCSSFLPTAFPRQTNDDSDSLDQTNLAKPKQETPTCPSGCLCQVDGLFMRVTCHVDHLTLISPKETVTSLDLSNNNLTQIPTAVARFKNLKNLSIANNRIKDFNYLIFDYLQQLKTFDISGNNLTWNTSHISETLMLTNLEELNLSSNNISNFFVEIEGVRSPISETLKILDISFNNITFMLDRNDLNGFKALKTLNLTGNKIQWFNEIISSSIEILDLSQCQIAHIRIRAFTRMPSLKTLILNDNPELRMYPSIHPTSRSVHNLYVERCNLGTNFLLNFPHLNEVYLSGNPMRYIPKMAFIHNPQMEIVDVAQAGIASIDSKAFVNLTFLHVVDLSDNILETLPGDLFKANKYLEILKLAKNRFKVFPCIENHSLLVLDLHGCDIKVIQSASLTTTPKLQHLNLSRNPIQALPINWKSNSLTSLDLSYCLLTEIEPNNFIHLTGLQELKLDGNRLTDGLSPALFPKSLLHLSLIDNPWRCECTSNIFRQFYNYLTQKSGPGALARDSELICHTPKTANEDTWGYACYQEWYPSRTSIDRHIWLVMLGIMSVSALMYVVFTVGHHYCQDRRAYQEAMQECRIEEARARIAQLRQSQLSEHPFQNAPDPRDTVGPPSYEEALQMLAVQPEDNTGKRMSSVHIQTDEYHPFEINTEMAVTSADDNIGPHRTSIEYIFKSENSKCTDDDDYEFDANESDETDSMDEGNNAKNYPSETEL